MDHRIPSYLEGDANKNAALVLEQFTLPGAPFITVLDTPNGKRDLVEECFTHFHLVLDHLFSMQQGTFRKTKNKDSLEYAYDATHESDHRILPEANGHLRHIAHTYIATNAARLLNRRDIAKITADALLLMMQKEIFSLIKVLEASAFTIPPQKESVQTTLFLQRCFLPFLHQIQHALVFDWLHRGSEDTFDGKTTLFPFAYSPYETSKPLQTPTVDQVMRKYYQGLIGESQKFFETICPLITDKDQEHQAQLQTNLVQGIREVKQGFMPGYEAQDTVRMRLDWQQDLEARFATLTRLLVDASIEGKKLPEVRFLVEEEGKAYYIEMTQQFSRFHREKLKNKGQAESGAAPLLRIYAKDAPPAPMMMHIKKGAYGISLKNDATYYMFEQFDYGMLPARVAEALPRNEVFAAYMPIFGFLDTARTTPGGLAWAERVFLPALDALAEEYLANEVFDEETEMQVEIQAEQLLQVMTEEPAEAAQSEYTAPKVTHQYVRSGDIFYDAAMDKLYYLRATKSLVTANDENKALYHRLTGETIPEYKVLRTLQYERSAVTWGDVRQTLERYFGAEKLRQQGSHMQFDTFTDDEATLLAHDNTVAKRKTLKSVLKRLRIPEPLFWVLVSKTHRLAGMTKSNVREIMEQI